MSWGEEEFGKPKDKKPEPEVAKPESKPEPVKPLPTAVETKPVPPPEELPPIDIDKVKEAVDKPPVKVDMRRQIKPQLKCTSEELKVKRKGWRDSFLKKHGFTKVSEYNKMLRQRRIEAYRRKQGLS